MSVKIVLLRGRRGYESDGDDDHDDDDDDDDNDDGCNCGAVGATQRI